MMRRICGASKEASVKRGFEEDWSIDCVSDLVRHVVGLGGLVML